MGEYMKRSEYISRDAAISKIRDQGVLGGDYDAYEREEDVVDMLNSIPAADVVEVRHGRWIEQEEWTGVEAFGFKEMVVGSFKCSACGYVVDVSEGNFNYCPSCGAVMDGGQDDGI